MKRPVRWSRRALNDFKAQIDYIARDNAEAALRVADHIRDTAVALGARAIGRRGRVATTHEKTVVGLPYVIAYKIMMGSRGEFILIARVIHTSRNWPRGKWPN